MHTLSFLLFGCSNEPQYTPPIVTPLPIEKEAEEPSLTAPAPTEGFVSTILKADGQKDPKRTNKSDFYYAVEVSKTEVTQQEFSDITGWNPSFFGGCGAECIHNNTTQENAMENDVQEGEDTLHAECFDVRTLKPFDCGPNCPVESVSWYETIAYTNILSKKNYLPECFVMNNIICTDGTKAQNEPLLCMNNTQKGIISADVQIAGDIHLIACEGYRLLTSEEWTDIARASGDGPLYTSENNDGTLSQKGCTLDPNLDKIAWYGANSQGVPHPVAQKAPNALGVYDMLGNVTEWVYDKVHRPDLDDSSTENPFDSSTLTPEERKKIEEEKKLFLIPDRQQRGGTWLEYGLYCQVDKSTSMPPSERDGSAGFRVIRTTTQQ